MKQELYQKLLSEAKDWISSNDPSHDFSHAVRVLNNALYISSKEGGDKDVIIPAALFHDVIIYNKDDEKSICSAMESALLTGTILKNMNYDSLKIDKVKQAIEEHSYSAGIKPESLESKIIQDADRLEAVGAISIMRVFSSTGQMRRPFYNYDDPFCESRTPESNSYALDFFYQRSLETAYKLNTLTAIDMSLERIRFLHGFINQLKSEILINDYTDSLY